MTEQELTDLEYILDDLNDKSLGPYERVMKLKIKDLEARVAEVVSDRDPLEVKIIDLEAKLAEAENIINGFKTSKYIGEYRHEQRALKSVKVEG